MVEPITQGFSTLCHGTSVGTTKINGKQITRIFVSNPNPNWHSFYLVGFVRARSVEEGVIGSVCIGNGGGRGRVWLFT